MITESNFRVLSIIIVLVGVLLVACQRTPPPFECTDAIGCVDIAPGEPIKLGVIQALSGGAARPGTTQVRSLQLAIAQRDGQLLDHPIELQTEDDHCSPEGGTTAALKIVADPQVVAILGTFCSGAAVTASPVMSEAGLVMISGGNSAPSLTSIGGDQGADWHPGYFRTFPSEVERGKAAAIFVFEELGFTKAATLNDGDAFTRGLTDVFGQVFTSLGGEIVLDATVNKGDEDMGPVMAAVADSGAEYLFFALFQPEADFMVLQAKETAGLESLQMMSSGSFLDSFIEAIGDAGTGMYFSGYTVFEGETYESLRAEYEAHFGGPPFGECFATGYDAANVLLDAIEAVAEKDAGGTLHIGRQALRDYLYAVTGFEGVSGTLSCDQFGDCGAGRFSIFRLDDPSAGVEGLRANTVFTYTPE